jgi:Zn-dependent M28 family amino/carboxypeptidase
VAAVLGLARLLVDGELQEKPAWPLGRRAIHFVIFSGHEPGLMGSWHFVNDRMVDLATLAAILNFDGIGLGLYTFSIRACGPRDYLEALHAWVEGSGFDVEWTIGPGGTDCTTFSAFETTTISVSQSFNNWHHTSGDNLSLCSPASVEDAIELSRGILQRVAGDPTVPRSYDQPLRDSCRAYRTQYGWGRF